MASTEHTPGERATIKIDPSGDIILQVGDQDHRTDVLVSSKVLSIASRVFAAMFGPTFKEGNSLSPTRACEIPLPEDDPVSVILLCKCLHFRSDQIPAGLDYPAPRTFAILCDKYDCTKAVRAWNELWLRKWETQSCDEGFEALLFVIYALDCPVAFSSISKRAILHQVGPFSTRREVEGIDMAYDDLLAILEARRTTVMIDLQQSIEDLATPTLEKGIGSLCPFRASSTHSYLCGLRDCGLWPLSEAFRGSSLSTIFDRLSSFKETNTKLQTTNHKTTSCECDVCGMRFRSLIREIRKIHLSAVSGLCLDCVKSECLGKELACRVKHFPQES